MRIVVLLETLYGCHVGLQAQARWHCRCGGPRAQHILHSNDFATRSLRLRFAIQGDVGLDSEALHSQQEHSEIVQGDVSVVRAAQYHPHLPQQIFLL